MATRNPPPSRPSSLGVSTARPDRTQASAPPVVGFGGQVERGTDIFTYITPVGINIGQNTPVLYNGDRLWADVVLELETAGPVAVGTRADIAPILSGKGQLLQTGVPLRFRIAKGTRLYILATAINRVKVTIEPIPWAEEILAAINAIGRK